MTHIRILHRDPNGAIFDGGEDFAPEHFAGQVPMIGDMIVNPGVLQGQDRQLPQNRQIWKVVGRVFNPRDNEDYVSLIVESRDGNLADEAFL
ncbi:MAG: hypothetical protein ACT4N8_12910 [Sphingosinicella sp.]|uniref:hypothetical protein n=1 Tax=Sphingosinicella sp. TaxID=1917971 RepID=UPI004037B7C8